MKSEVTARMPKTPPPAFPTSKAKSLPPKEVITSPDPAPTTFTVQESMRTVRNRSLIQNTAPQSQALTISRILWRCVI